MIVAPLTYEHLHMTPFCLGFLENNSYILTDDRSDECVVIDPSFHFEPVLEEIKRSNLKLREVWLTHGHFDHFIGTKCLNSLDPAVPVALHPLDKELYLEGGESQRASSDLTGGCPLPSLDLADGMILKVGKYEAKVLLTPGHSPGHCCFYFPEPGWLFSGDLVFYHSYGRTDLMGGDGSALVKSIRESVLTLPDDTIIFPGHNDFTTVKDERRFYSGF